MVTRAIRGYEDDVWQDFREIFVAWQEAENCDLVQKLRRRLSGLIQRVLTVLMPNSPSSCQNVACKPYLLASSSAINIREEAGESWLSQVMLYNDY